MAKEARKILACFRNKKELKLIVEDKEITANSYQNTKVEEKDGKYFQHYITLYDS